MLASLRFVLTTRANLAPKHSRKGRIAPPKFSHFALFPAATLTYCIRKMHTNRTKILHFTHKSVMIKDPKVKEC